MQRFLQAAFWAAVLLAFVAAELPEAYAPHFSLWDKALHFLTFLTLALLGAFAHPRRTFVAVGAGLALFGALIEIVQALPMIHRDAEVLDWVADLLGIAAAFAPLRLSGLPRSRRASEPGR